MQELKTLINYLSKQKIGQIDIITEPTNLEEKSKILYNGLKDGSITDDNEAMIVLYGNVEKKETYRKLKYRLTQKLLNTTFLSDIQNNSKTEFAKANLTLVKNWSAYEMLKFQGYTGFNLEQTEKLVKSAIKLERLDLAISIVKRQKLRYGVFEYNNSKYNKYKTLLDQLLHSYNIETIVEEIYTELAYLVLSKKTEGALNKINESEKKLLNLENEISSLDSFTIRFYFYNSIYFVGMLKKDIDLMSKYCPIALEYFLNKKGYNDVGIYSFTQKMGLVHLTKQEYAKALHFFNECLKYNTKPGSMRWQYHYTYKFLTQFLLNDYKSAYTTLSTLMNDKLFKKLKPAFQQPWFIKEAFINFLVRLGKINPDEISTTKLRPFRISRFLNEVTDPSSDKKGQNVTINIIQLLFLLLEDDHDKIMLKINSLQQYSFRNLKGKEHIRKRAFIKMLAKLDDGSYNRKRIESKAKNHITKLKENPMDFSEQNLQIEIIPYEQLWAEIMDLLDTKKKSS